MKRTLAHIAVAALAVGAMGCAAGRPASKPVVKDEGPYRLESEGQVPLDPSVIREDVDRAEEFKEVAVTEGEVPVEDIGLEEEDVATSEATDSTLATLPGFRVQIFASGVYTSAEEVRQQAAGTLGVAAYVERIDGVYKVRVGDCPSRTDAEDLLRRCRGAGYTDAWIVVSAIFKSPGG